MKNIIYVLGDSLSTAYDLKEDQGWPYKLSKKLELDLVNLAVPAGDNFFIYNSYLSILDKINQDDIVLIGWTHFSRKTFVYDSTNPAHKEAISKGRHYKLPDVDLFRSFNTGTKNKDTYLNFGPRQSNFPFFDTWYDNYYSEFEQKCNLQSYHNSVCLTCVGKYVPFFFSQSSVGGTRLPESLTALDFIIERNLYLSEDNMHFNETGHDLWSELLYEKINSLAATRKLD
jgi:lysophospholipase L1-like esterase